MKKVAILDARHGGNRDIKNSYMVAYRNLDTLSDMLNADLFINPEDIKINNKYDVIICGFGSMSTEREISTKFLENNAHAKIFWLVGDYEQSTFAPLFYSGLRFDVIATFGDHEIKNKNMDKQHKVNINALLNRKPNEPQKKKYDICYYGRWRPDRIKYFKQYMGSDMILSTAKKNMKMWSHNGCNPKFAEPFSWKKRRETLNLFWSSLYIEDEFSHKNYTAPGNRFYEMLWCNSVPLIDESCLRTFTLSGYYTDIEDHIISDQQDIKEKLLEIKNGNTFNLKKWQDAAIIEKEDVFNKIRDLINEC